MRGSLEMSPTVAKLWRTKPTYTSLNFCPRSMSTRNTHKHLNCLRHSHQIYINSERAALNFPNLNTCGCKINQNNNNSKKGEETRIIYRNVSRHIKVCNGTSILNQFLQPIGTGAESESDAYVALLSRRSLDFYIVWT